MSVPSKDIIANLIRQAKVAAGKAYAPYSQFKVGTALLAAGNKIFTGANIENVSYGLSICAERVAVFKAVSSGVKTLKSIVVYSVGKEFPVPCGACLQVLAEFNPKLEIILVNGKKQIKKKNLQDLLSEPFGLKG